MKISRILTIPSVKILLFIKEKGEVRHFLVGKLISSRSVLAYNLRALEQEGLITKRKETDKRAYYSLTEKGEKIAKSLSEMENSFC